VLAEREFDDGSGLPGIGVFGGFEENAADDDDERCLAPHPPGPQVAFPRKQGLRYRVRARQK